MDRKTLTTVGALAAVFLAGAAAHALLVEPAQAQSGVRTVAVSASADGMRAWVVTDGRVQYCQVNSNVWRCA